MKRMSLKNISSLFIVMAILLSAIASPAMAAASAGTVTRSFSTATVAPSGVLTVTITPAPAATFANPGYQVIENIPAGFTVTANTAGIATNAGNVYTFTNIGSAPFTYTLTAPAAAAAYTFSGTFKDQNADTGNVGGATIATVSAAPVILPGAQVPCPATTQANLCHTAPGLRVIDENSPAGLAALAAGPSWDAQSFQGFWYDLDDGLFSETLKINIGTLSNSQRTIPDRDTHPGGGLAYDSARQLKQFEVFKNGKGTVENGLDANGNKVKVGATVYGKLGWMAQEYVAVNGKAKKLGKLLIEQKSSASDKKTLTVGETWTIGDYTLTAKAIDVRATPRQVGLTLSWKGQKIDDKVLGQGDVYTYIETSIAGESDVPLFVTYIDTVFAGATSDMVQLRFTWAVSRDITEVKESDIYGVFKVVGATDTNLHLENDASIDLSRASTVTLAGNFMFKVADDKNNQLRFYPMVTRTIGEGGITVPSTGIGTITPTVIVTTTPTPAVTPTPTQTFISVEITGFTFVPATITISKGTTVIWTQGDSVTHTVTGTDFDSGGLSQGQTFSHTFNDEGTFNYGCTIHPTMTGKVIVTGTVTPTATPTPTLTPAVTSTPAPASTLSPEVAGWDANHDNLIQRSEAMAAVVNYFTGGITKENATAVVVAYFMG